jgi:hypothetical protein
MWFKRPEAIACAVPVEPFSRFSVAERDDVPELQGTAVEIQNHMTSLRAV